MFFLFLFERSKKFPVALDASASYNFRQQQLTICFQTPTEARAPFVVSSCTTAYVFSNKTVNMSFPLMTNNSNSAEFKLDVRKIERHILMKAFTIHLSFTYRDDLNRKLYRSEYSFDVRKFDLKFHLQLLTVRLDIRFQRSSERPICSVNSWSIAIPAKKSQDYTTTNLNGTISSTIWTPILKPKFSK